MISLSKHTVTQVGFLTGNQSFGYEWRVYRIEPKLKAFNTLDELTEFEYIIVFVSHVDNLNMTILPCDVNGRPTGYSIHHHIQGNDKIGMEELLTGIGAKISYAEDVDGEIKW